LYSFLYKTYACIYYAQKNYKVYYSVLASRDAMENDATETSEVSKCQLISQAKLDKFKLQYVTPNV